MSESLKPVITKVGLTALFNLQKDGLQAKISHVVLGDGDNGQGYKPSSDRISLANERGRYEIADGKPVGDKQIQVTAIADGDGEFWVTEVGFFLEDNTLFAIWSHETTPLAYKAKGVDLLLAFDLALDALPADSVTVVTGGESLNLHIAEELAETYFLMSSMATVQLQNMRRQVELNERLLKLERV